MESPYKDSLSDVYIWEVRGVTWFLDTSWEKYHVDTIVYECD